MQEEHDGGDAAGLAGLSRKSFMAGTVAAGAALGARRHRRRSRARPTRDVAERNPEPRAEALVLTKGKIHTMDGANRVVEEVRIEDGRFVEVGSRVDRAPRRRSSTSRAGRSSRG